MAITHLQNFIAPATSPTTFTLTGLTAGSLLVLAVSENSSTSMSPTFSDSVNGSWSQAGGSSSSAGGASGGKTYVSEVTQLWYVHNTASGTVTVTAGGGAPATGDFYMVSEFLGVATSPLDVTGSGTGAIAVLTLTATSGTTTAADDLVVGSFGTVAFNGGTTGTVTAGTGFTLVTDSSQFTLITNTTLASLIYKLDSGASLAAQSAVINTVNKCTITGVIATFKLSTAAAFIAAPNKPILQAVKRASLWCKHERREKSGLFLPRRRPFLPTSS